jgi:GST-like protein
MIDAYLAKSPAALKVPVMLEEAGLDYRIMPISVGDGEQHAPAYRAVSPNDKVPAIVDHAPADGGPPLSLFESGAILLYLAEKTGRFLPGDARGRATMMQWLFWQAAGLSPMSGQAVHFTIYAPETAKPYTQERYYREVNRL